MLNELFFLLKSEDHLCMVSVKKLIHLYGSNLIFCVTKDKVIMLKHFLLGVGLHNITGLKLVVQISELDDFYHSRFFLLLSSSLFIFTMFQSMSSGLLQVFVKLRSLRRTSNHVLYLIHEGRLF